MNPLNDDELDRLLRQAKPGGPRPSPALAERLMKSYRRQVPLPAAGGFRWSQLVAAAVLILVGAVADRTLMAAHKPDSPVVEERLVYKDCPAPSQAPGLTFNELQPVREIKPRVVRSMQDDR